MDAVRLMFAISTGNSSLKTMIFMRTLLLWLLKLHVFD